MTFSKGYGPTFWVDKFELSTQLTNPNQKSGTVKYNFLGGKKWAPITPILYHTHLTHLNQVVQSIFWLARIEHWIPKGFYQLLFVLTPWGRRSFKNCWKLLVRVLLCPSCSFATALDSDVNQTTGSGGHLSTWENRWMHAAVCLLRAGQPRSAGDAAKLGQFIGQFSGVTGDSIGVKGLSKFSLFNNNILRGWCLDTSKKISTNKY